MPNYGDGQDMMDIQGGAPMAATPSPTPVSASQMAQNAQQQAQPQGQPVTPLSAPTARPNEPVTAGAALGPGPGMSALGITPGQMQQGGQSAKQVVQTLAMHPDASPELKNLASMLGR
jgi:hypothetical protein